MTKYFKFRNAEICMFKIDGRSGYTGYILKGMGLSLYVTHDEIYDDLDSKVKCRRVNAKRDAYNLLKNY